MVRLRRMPSSLWFRCVCFLRFCVSQVPHNDTSRKNCTRKTNPFDAATKQKQASLVTRVLGFGSRIHQPPAFAPAAYSLRSTAYRLRGGAWSVCGGCLHLFGFGVSVFLCFPSWLRASLGFPPCRRAYSLRPTAFVAPWIVQSISCRSHEPNLGWIEYAVAPTIYQRRIQCCGMSPANGLVSTGSGGIVRICFSARVDQDDRSAGLIGSNRCPPKTLGQTQGRM